MTPGGMVEFEYAGSVREMTRASIKRKALRDWRVFIGDPEVTELPWNTSIMAHVNGSRTDRADPEVTVIVTMRWDKSDTETDSTDSESDS